MNKIHIIPDRSCQGEGISRGQTQDLLVYNADPNLNFKGMSIGSITFRNPDCR
jgi:hypothetical protein